MQTMEEDAEMEDEETSNEEVFQELDDFLHDPEG